MVPAIRPLMIWSNRFHRVTLDPDPGLGAESVSELRDLPQELDADLSLYLMPQTSPN